MLYFQDKHRKLFAFVKCVKRFRQVDQNRIFLFFQGNRDESYEVDEELAEQDATSLFEVIFQCLIYYNYKRFILNNNIM